MRMVEIGMTRQEMAGDDMPKPIFAELSPWQELEMLARSFNPDLPKDLTGYVITITMGKDGCRATAIPAV